MKRYEKEILENKNLDAPSENVLSKAKSAMPKKKRAVSLRNVLAIVSSCVAVSVAVICLPFLMPMNKASAPNGSGIIGDSIPMIKGEDITVEDITSIADYNSANGTDILHFEESKGATQYTYDNKVAAIEEKSSSDDVQIVFFVKFKENVKGMLEKEYDVYLAYLKGAIGYYIENVHVSCTTHSGITYVEFEQGDYIYYVKIYSVGETWINIIENLLSNKL